MKIRTLANTFLIRSSAQRFASGAHELLMKAQKIVSTKQSLTEGTLAWEGTAASAYTEQSTAMGADIRTSAEAFEKVAQVLNTLAGQLDEVNSLRQQVEQLRGEIRALEGELWGADDGRRSSIQQEINSLSYRASSLESQADSLEYRANAAASATFDEIAAMTNHLHVYEAKSGASNGTIKGYKWSFDLGGPSGYAEVMGTTHDVEEKVKLYKKRFGVKIVKRKSGNYAEVENGKVDGIRGKRYYLSNAEHYEQVMKYLDGKVAVLDSLTDVKSLGTILGYGGIIYDTGKDTYQNIKDHASVSKMVADATVDVGLGVGGMAASAWAGAETGALIGTAVGGPVGTLIGGAIGIAVGVGISLATQHFKLNGESVSDHLKDDLKNLIDGGTSRAKSAIGAISSLF